MSVQDIKATIELLKDADPIIIGGVSDEMIKEVETKLNVKFPPSYIYFLKELGFCMLSPHEFIGIPNKPNYLELGVVRETTEARKRELPDNFVVVFETGEGSKILINTTEIENEGEAVLYSWDVYPKFKESDLKRVYSNYGSFLKDKVEETLRVRKEMEEE